MNNNFFNELEEKNIKKDNKDYPINKEKNGLATFLKIVAYIELIVGFILSADNNELYVFLIYLGIFISILVFCEILQILHDIRKQLYQINMLNTKIQGKY